MWEAAAGVRAQVWRRASATTGAAPVVLDLDASLVQIHSEHKQGTAATYKGGFGFAPMFCFADATGEALAAILRPGNATANSIADQLAAVDAALAQLPAEISVGHRPGDEAALVRRAVRVRADSAGCSPKLAGALRDRNVGFAVVARTNARVQGAISLAIDAPDRWAPALTQGGEVRHGAEVAELTELIRLDHWPQRTRLIVRREPLHPGAQTSLFPDLEFRYWGHYTDAQGDPVELDVHMRAHAAPRTTSAGSRPRAWSGCPSATWRPTRRGWRSCASPPTWCAGSSCCASPVVWPPPNPRPCAGSCGMPRPGWCAAPDGASCAFSTAGPPPGIC